MDNEGLYLEYDELLAELYIGGSAKVTSSDIALSNKAVDAGGDLYEYDNAPNVGDVIYQGGYSACVIELLTGPNRLRINKTGTENGIANGNAKVLTSTSYPKKVGEDLIKEAMQKIDEATGQYFNKRTGTFFIEGNNTPIMHLPVPIIEINDLEINSTGISLVEGEDNDYVCFKGRVMPQDDRKNPRIKLNIGSGRDSIFVAPLTTRVFAKNTLTKIEGSFGYLEPDGSTPALIKKAIKLLAIDQINKPIVSSAGSSDTGPLKRVKVDLHEKEFFELKSDSQNSGASTSGDAEVDAIIARFRTPIRISGSIRWRPYDLY